MAKRAEEILQNKAETATYIDADGQKRTGTVASDIRAGLGENNYYSKTADAYGQMLEAQKQENAAAAADADASALAELQRQTEKINTEYGKSDKQLYRGYRTAVRDLPQQLAAMGITGGLSETSRVDLERGYGENLNASQLQRLAALGDLEAGDAEARRQREATLRQQNAQATQNYYAQLLGLGDQKHAEERAAAQLADEQKYAADILADERAYAAAQLADQRKYAAEQEAAALERARQEQSAEALADMGDFSGYVKLGIMTEAQAELAKQAWIAQNPELAAQMGYVKPSGGWYPGPGDDGKTMEQADWVDVAKDGLGEVNNGASAETVISDIARLYEVGALSSAGAKAAIQYVANQGYKNVTKPASD